MKGKWFHMRILYSLVFLRVFATYLFLSEAEAFCPISSWSTEFQEVESDMKRFYGRFSDYPLPLVPSSDCWEAKGYNKLALGRHSH